MLQRLELILVQLKLFQNHMVALQRLCRAEAQGKGCLFGMVLDQAFHRVETAVYRAAVLSRKAKILPARLFLIAGDMDCMLHQLRHAFIFCGRDRDNRRLEQSLHRVDVDRSAVFPHLVHHVQGDNHRHIHLQKLHRQIQVPLDVGRVHNIDHCIRLVLQDKIS